MSEGERLDDGLGLSRADLGRLVQRLSRVSPLGWRAIRSPVAAFLATMVELSERQQGRPLTLPDLSDHMLADAVAVIGGEVLDTLAESPDAATLEAARGAITAALAATR
jgi:hypothetical protein